MPVHDHERERASRQDAEVRARQRSRAIVTAIILFALVALFFAISIAKMT